MQRGANRVFNAENAEAQEAQRCEGGDFGRVDRGASRLELDGGMCETRRTNECLN